MLEISAMHGNGYFHVGEFDSENAERWELVNHCIQRCSQAMGYGRGTSKFFVFVINNKQSCIDSVV